MVKISSPRKLLKVPEKSIVLLEEYTNLIDTLGGHDEAIIRAMFLGFAAESVEANRVTYYFYDEINETLFPNVTMVYKNNKLIPYDYYSDLKDIAIKIGNDACGSAVKIKDHVFIENTSTNKQYKGYVDKKIKLKTHSIIDIPLIIDDKILGVIEVANAGRNRHLNRIDYSVISIITRITLITMEKTKLYGWSVTDNLTQLFNFQYLQISMEKELMRAKRYPKNVGVIMLDIDNFKEINDTYGHDAGNVVLKGIADIIRDEIRNVDMPVRYGGDEFLLLLPETNIKGTEIVANRILEKVNMERFIIENNKSIHATISLGLTSARKHKVLNKDKLIKKADKVLYVAKNKGKNRISILE